jgi:FKBP-type peptidyl-prolyl cis-trans isomerase SlyD
MEISPKKVVGITYTLTLTNGEIADQATEERPFLFIHGIGQTLDAFDQNLHGLSSGKPFKFSLSAADGYGDVNPGMVVDIAKSIFEGPEVPKDLLIVGNTVPMQDQEGNALHGTILEIDDEKVKMDFNHPLAGQDLHFTGTVVSVRDASDDELNHGHVHGEGGHHH